MFCVWFLVPESNLLIVFWCNEGDPWMREAEMIQIEESDPGGLRNKIHWKSFFICINWRLAHIYDPGCSDNFSYTAVSPEKCLIIIRVDQPICTHLEVCCCTPNFITSLKRVYSSSMTWHEYALWAGGQPWACIFIVMCSIGFKSWQMKSLR